MPPPLLLLRLSLCCCFWRGATCWPARVTRLIALQGLIKSRARATKPAPSSPFNLFPLPPPHVYYTAPLFTLNAFRLTHTLPDLRDAHARPITRAVDDHRLPARVLKPSLGCQGLPVSPSAATSAGTSSGSPPSRAATHTSSTTPAQRLDAPTHPHTHSTRRKPTPSNPPAATRVTGPCELRRSPAALLSLQLLKGPRVALSRLRPRLIYLSLRPSPELLHPPPPSAHTC